MKNNIFVFTDLQSLNGGDKLKENCTFKMKVYLHHANIFLIVLSEKIEGKIRKLEGKITSFVHIQIIRSRDVAAAKALFSVIKCIAFGCL